MNDCSSLGIAFNVWLTNSFNRSSVLSETQLDLSCSVKQPNRSWNIFVQMKGRQKKRKDMPVSVKRGGWEIPLDDGKGMLTLHMRRGDPAGLPKTKPQLAKIQKFFFKKIGLTNPCVWDADPSLAFSAIQQQVSFFQISWGLAAFFFLRFLEFNRLDDTTTH